MCVCVCVNLFVCDYHLFSGLFPECSSYRTLDSKDRAMSVRRAGNFLKCDQKDLSMAWYRFSGDAGNQIATSCPSQEHCGTHAPGWMQGAHPTVAEGQVTRKVCYNWLKSCCHWSNHIKVRNCGRFYVYQLTKTPLCWLRYCGNAGQGTNLYMKTKLYYCNNSSFV